MAIQSTDLFVVQQGDVNKSLSMGALETHLDSVIGGDESLWKEDGNAVTPKKTGADLKIEGSFTAASTGQFGSDVCIPDLAFANGSVTGLKLRANGRVEAANSTGDFEIWKGFTAGNSTPTSTIKADGSITAVGRVTANDIKSGDLTEDTIAGQFYNSSADAGKPAIYARNNNVAGNVWTGVGGSTVTSTIGSNGSVTFAGTGFKVTAGGSGGALVDINRGINADALRIFSITNGTTSSSPTISLNSNGQIQVKGFPENGAADGAVIRDSGCIQVSRAAGSTLWAGYKTGTTAYTSRIDSNGNATFDGTIQFDMSKLATLPS